VDYVTLRPLRSVRLLLQFLASKLYHFLIQSSSPFRMTNLASIVGLGAYKAFA
jgi:hypothetical protein